MVGSEVSIFSHETLTEVLDNISTITFITTAASGSNDYSYIGGSITHTTQVKSDQAN